MRLLVVHPPYYPRRSRMSTWVAGAKELLSSRRFMPCSTYEAIRSEIDRRQQKVLILLCLDDEALTLSHKEIEQLSPLAEKKGFKVMIFSDSKEHNTCKAYVVTSRELQQVSFHSIVSLFI